MRLQRIRLFALLGTLGLGSALSAQDTLWRLEGKEQSFWLGGLPISIGDLDHDGVGDFVMKYFLSTAQYDGVQGFVTMSGAGPRALSVSPPTTRYQRRTFAVGDVDGDGVRDYAYEYPKPSTNECHIAINSSRTHQELLDIYVDDGTAILYLEGNIDLNGDGKNDYITQSDRSLSGGGAIYAFRHDGQLLYKLRASPAYGFASSVARLGVDFDHDGIEDFIAGVPYTPITGDALLIMSGKTGQVLKTFPNTAGSSYLVSQACRAIGDLDGDGLPEIAGGGGLGIQIFSIVTGNRLLLLALPPGATQTGNDATYGGFDLDQDGVPDIVSVCDEPYPPFGLGNAAWSGRDGKVLWHTREVGMGGCCILMPDAVNPFPRIAISLDGYGSIQSSPGFLGGVKVVGGNPNRSAPYGVGCSTASSVPQPRLGLREIDGRPGWRRLTVSNTVPGSPAVLMLGFSHTAYAGRPLPLDLGVVGLPTCSLFTSIDYSVPFVTGTGGLSSGFASYDLPVQGLTSNPNDLLHAQWLVGIPTTPGWCALSQAIAMATNTP